MAKKVKKTNTFLYQANQRGSILAFSLIIMFVLMIIAVGAAAVAVKEIRMASITGKSVVAYQAADSGAEVAMEKIIGHSWTVNDFDGDPDLTCVDGDESDPAIITGDAPSGEYDLTFEDANGVISECDDNDVIIKIKSSGSYAGTHRAVEVSL